MRDSPIESVADTAFWVATYRANEGDRIDALFSDPLAGRLVEGRGRAIAEQMADATTTGWAVVVRTCIIDDYIRGAIAEGCDTVLNLGAGLDTRPYRLELPPSLTWIEVDFPATIAFKEERLKGEKPRCRLERVAADLSHAPARRQLFDEVNARSRSVLVLTEGVVAYLSNADVAALAADLHAQPRFRFWVVEYLAPRLLTMARLLARRRRRQMANAPVKFRPGDWLAFFGDRGWVPREIRYLAEEGRRRNRPAPVPWWAKIMIRVISRKKRGALGKGYGYALMENSTRA